MNGAFATAGLRFGGAELRLYERVRFACPVILTLVPQGRMVDGYSMDVSLGGVRVATRFSIPTGQIVRIEFRMQVNGRTVAEGVLGQVMNLKADEDGNSLGIQFTDALSAKVAPRLVARIGSLSG